jgi:hypothetical protein
VWREAGSQDFYAALRRDGGVAADGSSRRRRCPSVARAAPRSCDRDGRTRHGAAGAAPATPPLCPRTPRSPRNPPPPPRSPRKHPLPCPGTIPNPLIPPVSQPGEPRRLSPIHPNTCDVSTHPKGLAATVGSCSTRSSSPLTRFLPSARGRADQAGADVSPNPDDPATVQTRRRTCVPHRRARSPCRLVPRCIHPVSLHSPGGRLKMCRSSIRIARSIPTFPRPVGDMSQGQGDRFAKTRRCAYTGLPVVRFGEWP